jgi:hypothetical protein
MWLDWPYLFVIYIVLQRWLGRNLINKKTNGCTAQHNKQNVKHTHSHTHTHTHTHTHIYIYTHTCNCIFIFIFIFFMEKEIPWEHFLIKF